MKLLTSIAIPYPGLYDELMREYVCTTKEELNVSPELFLEQCLNFSFDKDLNVRVMCAERASVPGLIDKLKMIAKIIRSNIPELGSMELSLTEFFHQDVIFDVITFYPATESKWS